MLCTKSFRLLLMKHLSLSNIYTIQRRNTSDLCNFFTKILGFTSSKATDAFLQKHKYLIDVDAGAVSGSIRYLNEIGITTESIRDQPLILRNRRIILKNRHEILRECGFSTVSISHLHYYNTVVRKSETELKSLGIIDNSINVQERLANRLNVQLDRCKEDADLKTIRLHYLRLFFAENGYLTAKEFDDVRHMVHIKRNSYESTEKLIKILTDKFDIPKNEIGYYKHGLRTDPDNLDELLKIKIADGSVNTRDFLKQHPAVMVLPADAVRETLNALVEFGVDGESMIRHPFVLVQLLRLDPTVVQQRLKYIEASQHFRTMKYHPMILKLIYKYHKAEQRIKQLEANDRKCFNITSVICNKRDGSPSDKHMRRDCLRFLTMSLKMDAKEVKAEMVRHPYWNNVPIFEVENTIATLRVEGFDLADIRASIHIVLYPGEVVVSRLRKLSEIETIEGHRWAELSKSVQLKLILYDIEVERDFCGDGVWRDGKNPNG